MKTITSLLLCVFTVSCRTVAPSEYPYIIFLGNDPKQVNATMSIYIPEGSTVTEVRQFMSVNGFKCTWTGFSCRNTNRIDQLVFEGKRPYPESDYIFETEWKYHVECRFGLLSDDERLYQILAGMEAEYDQRKPKTRSHNQVSETIGAHAPQSQH